MLRQASPFVLNLRLQLLSFMLQFAYQCVVSQQQRFESFQVHRQGFGENNMLASRDEKPNVFAAEMFGYDLIRR